MFVVLQSIQDKQGTQPEWKANIRLLPDYCLRHNAGSYRQLGNSWFCCIYGVNHACSDPSWIERRALDTIGFQIDSQLSIMTTTADILAQ